MKTLRIYPSEAGYFNYDNTYVKTELNPVLYNDLRTILNKRVNIENKKVFFAKTKLKQELVKQRFNCKKVNSIEKADIIIVDKIVDNTSYICIPYSTYEIIKNYLDKVVFFTTVDNSNIKYDPLTIEDAKKLFNLSLIKDQTSEKLLKHNLLNININMYPLFFNILIRNIRIKDSDFLLKNHMHGKPYYGIRCSSKFSEYWLKNNPLAYDIDFLIELFNNINYEINLKKNPDGTISSYGVEHKVAETVTVQSWEL